MSKTSVAILLGGLLIPAQAALEVDFVTTRGTITATLEYVKTPKAAANLITLAEGTRNWIDPLTGQVRQSPFFNGQKFFRVTNNGTQKLIETGSPTGTGADGPGYTFPDELDATLTHVPYVLSMSNSGPNTNGARFCFTGNVTMSARDKQNTVFGKVTLASSRTVIDDILAAGANATTITSVQVRRTDAQAIAFAEGTVPLPAVQPVPSPLWVIPGTAVHWMGSQPAASMLCAHQSINLVDWLPHYRHMIGLGDSLPGASQWIDAADEPTRFYYFSLVNIPNMTGITCFANRKLTIVSPGAGTLIYQFNAAGTGGTYQNILFPGDPPFFSGNFVVRNEIPTLFDGYSFQVLLYATGLGGSPFNLIRGGLDVVGPSAISGRHLTELRSTLTNTVFMDGGPLELTHP